MDKAISYDGDPSVPLLWVLRDELGLTGTKFGCGERLLRRLHRASGWRGGALVPGRRSREAAGKEVVTIEGLDPQRQPSRCSVAWRETSAPQCGYCHAGQIMQAAALLASNAEADARTTSPTAMAGNICRCGCYQRIAEAIASPRRECKP